MQMAPVADSGSSAGLATGEPGSKLTFDGVGMSPHGHAVRNPLFSASTAVMLADTARALLGMPRTPAIWMVSVCPGAIRTPFCPALTSGRPESRVSVKRNGELGVNRLVVVDDTNPTASTARSTSTLVNRHTVPRLET